MTGIPLTQKKMENELAALQARVRNLENLRPKRVAGGITRLADLSDVDIEGAEDDEVLTYDLASELWIRGRGNGVPGWLEDTDSGSISVTSGSPSDFTFDAEVSVPAKSAQVVLIDAQITAGAGALGMFERYGDPGSFVQVWPAWKITAYNYTSDPDADAPTGAVGISVCSAQCALWVWNDTDDTVVYGIRSNVYPISVEDWDADVTVTVRSVYYV